MLRYHRLSLLYLLSLDNQSQLSAGLRQALNHLHLLGLPKPVMVILNSVFPKSMEHHLSHLIRVEKNVIHTRRRSINKEQAVRGLLSLSISSFHLSESIT